MADVKDGLLYSKSHQWFDPASGKVGITDHAQEQLGEIVYVELSWDDGLAGKAVSQVTFDGDEPSSDPIEDVSVESQKAVGDLYAPVSGTIPAWPDTNRKSPARMAVEYAP